MRNKQRSTHPRWGVALQVWGERFLGFMFGAATCVIYESTKSLSTTFAVAVVFLLVLLAHALVESKHLKLI